MQKYLRNFEYILLHFLHVLHDNIVNEFLGIYAVHVIQVIPFCILDLQVINSLLNYSIAL